MKIEILLKTENQDAQNKIIGNIRELKRYTNLEPGAELPSERTLLEKFGVSRSNIREAIQKLEFYGILISKLQSGTFIVDIGSVAMDGMLAEILRLEEPNFKSLVEKRIL